MGAVPILCIKINLLCSSNSININIQNPQRSDEGLSSVEGASITKSEDSEPESELAIVPLLKKRRISNVLPSIPPPPKLFPKKSDHHSASPPPPPCKVKKEQKEEPKKKRTGKVEEEHSSLCKAFGTTVCKRCQQDYNKFEPSQDIAKNTRVITKIYSTQFRKFHFRR